MRQRWSNYVNLPEIKNIKDKIVKNYTNKIIFLEEPHEYYLDGIKFECVSNVTHRYKPVSAEKMAENCYNKWIRDQDKTYRYYGMSVEEILKEWEKISGEACEFGTNVHAFGESMFYYAMGEDDKILKECKDRFQSGKPIPQNTHEEAILKFWNDLPECFVPILAETKVFNRQGTPYAGTFDLLVYYVEEPNSPNNGLVIFDYKTNKDLYKNYREQKLLWPFQNMLDMPLSFYILQLNCYQIPMENLGLKVIGRRLIWAKPDGEYEKISLDNISNDVRDALNIPTAKEIIEKKLL